MAKDNCDGFMGSQIESIASLLGTMRRVPTMYEESIGQLRDLFDITLRNEFRESPLWSGTTKNFLDTSCSAITFVIDVQRFKPRPYEPGGLQEIRQIIKSMEDELVAAVLSDVTECVCARTSEVCYSVPEERIAS
jgi:hypothetical protein